MSDSLDDLAAFLMHRTADTEMSDARSLAVFVLVGAYQEGDAPSEVAAGLRAEAMAFSSHPDYRSEWRVTDADVLLLAANPLLLSTVGDAGPESPRAAPTAAPLIV
jgi:hypothetical protein